MASMTGVVSVIGDLTIGRDQSDAIADLSALSSLRCVQGDVSIDWAEQLADLSGLEHLQQVLGSVYVGAHNRKLASLNGLNGLERVAVDFELYDVRDLKTTVGLESLREVGRHLSLRYNWQLVDLAGFSALRNVGGSLLLDSNEALTDITGLQHLEAVGDAMPNDSDGILEGLVITGSPLSNLHGLESLRRVTRGVWIMQTYLTSLDGLKLDKIITIDRCWDKPGDAGCAFAPATLQISGNPRLVSVDSLLSVSAFGPTGHIAIIDNAVLPEAQRNQLIQHLKDVELPANPAWNHM
jgi:hypothetical protein